MKLLYAIIFFMAVSNIKCQFFQSLLGDSPSKLDPPSLPDNETDNQEPNKNSESPEFVVARAKPIFPYAPLTPIVDYGHNFFFAGPRGPVIINKDNLLNGFPYVSPVHQEILQTPYVFPHPALHGFLPHVIPHAIPQVIPHAIPPVIPQVIPYPISQVIPHASPQVIPQAIPQVIPYPISQVIPHATPHVIPQAIPQVIPYPISQVIPHAIPQVIPNAIPQVIPNAIPQVIPQIISQVIPQVIPHAVPHALPHVIPHVIPHASLFPEFGYYNNVPQFHQPYLTHGGLHIPNDGFEVVPS